MNPETDIYIGCDHDVLIEGAKKRAEGAFLNAADCAWALLDATLALVDPAATGTLTAAGPGGNYAGVIDKTYTAMLARNATYFVRITFAEAGYEDTRYLERTAKLRGKT